jgi:hypothetical protein
MLHTRKGEWNRVKRKTKQTIRKVTKLTLHNRSTLFFFVYLPETYRFPLGTTSIPQEKQTTIKFSYPQGSCNTNGSLSAPFATLHSTASGTEPKCAATTTTVRDVRNELHKVYENCLLYKELSHNTKYGSR